MEKKNKPHFNLIDALLLLGVLLCIAGIIYITVFGGSIGNIGKKINEKNIVYSVKVKGIPDLMRGKVGIGDAVLGKDGKTELGEVIDVQYSDSEEDGMIDMRITVSAKAVQNEKGVFVLSGIEMRIGTEFGFRVPFFTGDGICVSVSEVSE